MQKPFKLARDPNARLLTFTSIRGSRGQIPWQYPGPKPQIKLDGNPCASQMFAPNLVGASLPASLNRHLGSGYWNILQDYWQLICGATPKPQTNTRKGGKTPRVLLLLREIFFMPPFFADSTDAQIGQALSCEHYDCETRQEINIGSGNSFAAEAFSRVQKNIDTWLKWVCKYVNWPNFWTMTMIIIVMIWYSTYLLSRNKKW